MATKAPIPPFTPEHASLCRKGLRALSEAREKITKAQACGVDCDQDLAILEELKRSLESFQSNFCEPQYVSPKEDNPSGAKTD